MKKVFKILKFSLAILLSLYSLLIVYSLFFYSSAERFDIAAHMQGGYLSQSMFEILKFQEPENDEIYFEQSVPFNKRGDHATGFAILNKAVELNPKVHLGYRGYIQLRFLRNYRAALEDFNRLDSLTPQIVDTPWGEDIDFLRGEAYFGLKEYEKARMHFLNSISNQGEEWVDIQAFVYAGLCEERLGNMDQAKEHFQQAIHQSKYTVEAHLGLARIYLKQELFEEANSHLEQAEKYMVYKRDDPYNEYLNEVYLEDIEELKDSLAQ
ncbi:tetratricopeptide repeat protein [Pontixanthobacter gangjinensis]|uniref:Tetratricopeptide repeat protein n=1 Tax=Christiangramia aestuarii TaxID=1028746 RepID=A0A7K1LNR8_9FLAO|nr:tetratricopeptide repeat protein [Christiangramia aestuarii]MUP42455.1 tetratricopeptide repeat protein [Christiangramia aestuarii]